VRLGRNDSLDFRDSVEPAARRAWVYAIMRPILDLMQTIPTFVYLIPALILFGLHQLRISGP